MDKFLGCVIGVLILAALDFLLAWGFMALWNWIVPSAFHGPELDYWKAWGLMTLLSFIGSFFKSSTSKSGK